MRVGIIGGGWSGIFSLKHCLDEGLDAVLFESEKTLGGQWHYSPKRNGGVLQHTLSVSSKLFMCPSDFPMPDNYPEFPNANLVFEHFINYIKNFNLEKHIRLSKKVSAVKKTGNNYKIEFNNGETQEFDKVIIATGALGKINTPDDLYYKNFPGPMFHSHYYKSRRQELVGKRVLLVGGSDTACELAFDLCKEAQVTVSMRQGTWFQDRLVSKYYKSREPMPSDMFYNVFFDFILKKIDLIF